MPASKQTNQRTTEDAARTAQAVSDGTWSSRLSDQRVISDSISSLIAILLVILLVVFFFLTFNNVMTVNERINTIRNGPFPVSVASGRLETLLVQVRTVSSRAIYNHDAVALDSIEEGYESVNEDMERNLTAIRNNFSTDDDKADQLSDAYAELKELQREYLAYCADPDITAADIQTYGEGTIDPLIQEMLNLDQDILDDATSEVDDIYAAVTSAGVITMVISCILMAAVGVSLGVYLFLLWRKNEREKELRETLEDALKIAESANEAKSAFLSNMSHDIRTPMNAIVGLTAIARTHLDDEARVRSSLERITASSQHLLSLINDILDMSKIESGKIVLNNEVFSFTKLIDECLAIVQSPARAKNLEFIVDREPIVHDHLQGDRMRLNQVLINLLSNAIKYTPEQGRIVFTISEQHPDLTPDDEETSAGTKPASCLFKFIVSDNGIGMDESFLERIFDPFERDYNEVTSFTEGTGLGLAITKRVIDLMEGTIEVRSARGVGTTFTVVLPFKPATGALVEQEDAETAAADSDAALTEEGGGLSGRVLIVEDNALNREIATELITEMGVEVDTARDGVEAVEIIDSSPEGRYGLIFMDWQMPRMDGLEATRTILAHTKSDGRSHPPIVAMTANAFNEERAQALAAGMDGFMTKPINLRELKNILQTYLGAGAGRKPDDAG